MTSRGKDELDDEFEAFLAGRGELARQLSALPQPESPALLNDAIIASVKAEIAQERAAQQQAPQHPGAANDAGAAPPAFRPGWMTRWRMPMAMAASVIGAVLLMLEWQREDGAPLPVQTDMREQVKIADQPAQQPAPAAPAASQPAAQADAKAVAAPPPPPPPLPAARADRPAAAGRPADKVLADSTRAPATLGEPARPAPIYGRAAPAAPLASYGAAPPPPAPIAMPAPVVARATSAAEQAVRAAPAEAPTSTRMANPEADPKAAAWLNVIDEMLKADLRKDALAEWEKFRLAYPDYPVPDTLAKRIAAIK